jgi:hypothetical protein
MFFHSEIIKQNIVLWTHTHEMAYLIHLSFDILPKDFTLTRSELYHPSEHGECRCLASAVVSQ